MGDEEKNKGEELLFSFIAKASLSRTNYLYATDVA